MSNLKKYLEMITLWTDIKVISTSICKYCWKDFPLFDIEKKLLDKHFFKYPDYCSDCNFKLLNSLLNDKNLYRREDSKTWKSIISIFSEDFHWDVMDVKSYKQFILDDGGLDYAKNISWDIFWEFSNIYNSFPKASRLVYPELENSEYSSHVGWAKNVYMSYCVFVDCEDIYYSFRILSWCKNIFTSHNIFWSSNIYESNNIWNSHNIYFWENMVNCSDLLFCKDMNNCKNCIFSCNMVNKQYIIFNKQYEKNEYEKIKIDIYRMLNNKKEYSFLEQRYEGFLEKNLIKEACNTNRCEKVVWENTFDSKNSVNIFNCSGIDNCTNIINVWNSTNDNIINIFNSVELWTNCENIIWSCSLWTNIYNVFFSFWISNNSKNIYYSYDIENCEEIMFSVWLKNKKYCILNKVYEKWEYFKQKDKIIQKLISNKKWGNTIPIFAVNFPYNDTLAYDYFKVNKIIYPDLSEEIIDKNAEWVVKIKSNDFISNAVLDLDWKEKINIKWRTKNKEINIPENSTTINANDLPNIYEVNNNILNKIIVCKKSSRPYRIIKQELDFLKKKNLPLPTIHNEIRLDTLISSRPTWQLNIWKCDKCKNNCLTAYKEKPKHRVYCSRCYKGFMYS